MKKVEHGNKNGKKVFVGMSGGVDSSLSAALLKEQGFDVTGVFIKVWQPDFTLCTSKEDRRDAMRVASELDIPFITLNLEKEYKKEVIDYMMNEYSRGRTPNPDVMCNREIKFGAFLDFAKKNNADYVATGHYARTNGENLLEAVDKNKDQSYFLWAISKDNLNNIIFPVGEMEKEAVRKAAQKRGLWTKNKKDSQGLCFIGKIDVKDFLKKELGIKSGKVLTEEGVPIGIHDGVIFYTVGERHGFSVVQKKGETSAFYITKKDLENNILYVSKMIPKNCNLDIINLENENWFIKPSENKTYLARGRYRAKLEPVTLKKELNSWEAIPLSKELIPVPGQSLVIYDGEIVVGGGIIS